MVTMLSRRKLLLATLLTPLISWAGKSSAPPRLAVLDWGLTEMLLALGITPAAVAAPAWYRKLIPEPPLPESVVDLGLLFQPNLETLWALKPDMIVITPQHALLKPTLEKIAPTLTLPTHTLAGFITATRELGAKFDRQQQASTLIEQLQQTLNRIARQGREVKLPVFLGTAVDTLHLRLCTADSLPGNVLSACGLRNAWQGSSGAEGSVLVELTRIADTPAKLLLFVPEDQRDAMQRWRQSPLWQQLPLTRPQNLNLLNTPFSDTGALITAGRFATLLNDRIEAWRNE